MSIHFATKEKPVHRRIKCLDIRVEMFLQSLREQDGTNLLKSEGIPDDATIVGLTVDEIFNTVSLYVESKEFEEVDPLHAPPLLDVYFTRYTPDVIFPDRLGFWVGEDIVKRYTESLECRA